MRPNQAFDNSSDAECTVFARLRQAFAYDTFAIAFHSVNLSQHPEKRFAQIDFIVMTVKGIFVLEIKGGAVSCQEGIWQYLNRDKVITRTHNSPFNQAHTALQGLRQQLIEKFGKNVIDSICLGYGVVFPDCYFTSECVEWDKRMWCDKRELRDFEGWLGRFFDYWQYRNHSMPLHSLSETLFNEIVEWIRPNFDTLSNNVSDTDCVALAIMQNNSLPAPTIPQASGTNQNLKSTFADTKTINVTLSNLLSTLQVYLDKYLAIFQGSQISVVASDTLWMDLEQLYQVIAKQPKYRKATLVDSFSLSQIYTLQPTNLTFLRLSDMGNFKNDVIIGICERSQVANINFHHQAHHYCSILCLIQD